MTVELNERADFSLAHFERVAFGGESVRLGPGAVRTMERASAQAVAAGPPPSDPGRRPPLGGFGPAHLDEPAARGVLFSRLLTCVAGKTGVRPPVAARVAALLDGSAPAVPLDGLLCGGEQLALDHALAALDGSELEPAERAALWGGSPVAAAVGAAGAIRASRRWRQAVAVFALAIEAFGAPLGAYDEGLDVLWGDADETAALQALRRLLEGSAVDGRRPYQAPVSYRITPRLLGQAHRAVRSLQAAAADALVSVSDDAVLSAAAPGEQPGWLMTGGSLDTAAGPALGALASAWADLALLAEREITALNTADTSGLPVNLAVEGAGMGTYAYGWAAGSLAEEARVAAASPPLLAVLDDPVDDLASPTLAAYAQEQRAGGCLDGALAILALVSSQALFVTERRPAPALEPVLAAVRGHYPPIDAGAVDRMLHEEAARLQEAVGAGQLLVAL